MNPGSPPGHVRPADAASDDRHRRAWLPAAVWLLGWISLLTDTASEAIYPLLPLFLTQALGARPLALGVIEGAADAVSSVLKIASGWLADRFQRRRVFIVSGYTLSSLVRPLIGLASVWPQVFAIRLADRVGKGVRTAPRDAMLAAVADPDTRGRVFGFHRAMDHAGAVLGPVLASVFLWQAPGAYRPLFLFTVVPGVLVIALTLRVPRDSTPSSVRDALSDRRADSTRSWRAVPASLWRLFLVLAVFALGNSTDAYLLLRLSGVGVPVAAIPLLWALLHVVKASASLGGGLLADHLGRRPVMTAGWLVYVVVYAGFAIASGLPATVTLFLVYGVFFGLTEGVEKALVADLTPSHLRGTAFGLYDGVTGLGTLAASLIFGGIWEVFGPRPAFLTGAALALTATALLWSLVTPPRGEADGIDRTWHRT